MVPKFALLFSLLSTSRSILSMQNYCMCFSPFFCPHSIKIHTLPWHTHSYSMSLTSVLAFPCCVSLFIPRLSISSTYDFRLLLTLSVVSFTLSTTPQRCCDAGRHHFYMQQIPRIVRSSAHLTENNKAGNLVSFQAHRSWCERAIPKASLMKHKMARLNFTGIDVIALWNEWKLF